MDDKLDLFKKNNKKWMIINFITTFFSFVGIAYIYIYFNKVSSDLNFLGTIIYLVTLGLIAFNVILSWRIYFPDRRKIHLFRIYCCLEVAIFLNFFWLGEFDVLIALLSIASLYFIIKFILMTMSMIYYKKHDKEIFDSFLQTITTYSVDRTFLKTYYHVRTKDYSLVLMFVALGIAKLDYFAYLSVSVFALYQLHLISKYLGFDRKRRNFFMSIEAIIALFIIVIMLLLQNGIIKVENTTYKDIALLIFLLFIPSRLVIEPIYKLRNYERYRFIYIGEE